MNLASLTALVVATSTVRAIGAVLAILGVVAVVIYTIYSIFAGRAEAGAEVEIAPNRKPYYDDEHLEGKKLNRTLGISVALLAVSAVGLPLYWLGEPSRMENAEDGMLETFVSRGLEQYEEGSQCVNCHSAEGAGGTAPYTLLDSNGGFVAQVNWTAPALDTVLLRYSREEVFDIIDYGRPGTPMPAWGARGGGPRSDQQIDNLVDYLDSIQLPYEEAQRNAEVQLAIELNLLAEEDRDDAEKADAAVAQIDWQSLDTGAQAFVLGKTPAYAGGAYACGRCHTQGFSISTEEGAVEPADADLSAYVDYQQGSGAFGPALDDLVPRQFASVDELAEFISQGTEQGVPYGTRGVGEGGNGGMPGFGDNPNTEENTFDGMLSARMICAIARYESTLRGDEAPSGSVPTTTSTTTTTVAADEEEAEEEEEPAEQPLPFCEQAFQDAAGNGNTAATDGEESEE